MAKAVTGVDFEVREGPRRPGDPPELVADNSQIRALLNWQPRYDDLRVDRGDGLALGAEAEAKAKTLQGGDPQLRQSA